MLTHVLVDGAINTVIVAVAEELIANLWEAKDFTLVTILCHQLW